MLVASLELAKASDSARAARACIRHAVASEASQANDDLALIASELVANAVAYGDEPIDLHVLRDDSTLWIEVCDGDTNVDRVSPTAPRREVGGRGLQIVSELATAWGVRSCAGRKCVWASYELNPIR